MKRLLKKLYTTKDIIKKIAKCRAARLDFIVNTGTYAVGLLIALICLLRIDLNTSRPATVHLPYERLPKANQA